LLSSTRIRDHEFSSSQVRTSSSDYSAIRAQEQAPLHHRSVDSLIPARTQTAPKSNRLQCVTMPVGQAQRSSDFGTIAHGTFADRVPAAAFYPDSHTMEIYHDGYGNEAVTDPDILYPNPNPHQ